MSVTSLAAPVNVYCLKNDYALHVVTSDGVDTVGVRFESLIFYNMTSRNVWNTVRISVGGSNKKLRRLSSVGSQIGLRPPEVTCQKNTHSIPRLLQSIYLVAGFGR